MVVSFQEITHVHLQPSNGVKLMLNDTQTLTISTVARDYEEAWDPRYQEEVASGAASLRKAVITDGESLLRIAHSQSKQGVKRHVASVRDEVVDSDGVIHPVQFHLVWTYDADDPTGPSRAIALGAGCRDWVSAVETDILKGQS